MMVPAPPNELIRRCARAEGLLEGHTELPRKKGVWLVTWALMHTHHRCRR